MKHSRNKDRIAILESRIGALEVANLSMTERLTHINDLLDVAMHEVNEHVLSRLDINAIAEEERRAIQH